MSIEEKLGMFGLKLPEPSQPIGSYLSCIVSGNLLFISGVIPIKEGKVITGRFGKEIQTIDAKEIGTLIVLTMLSNIKKELGSLEKISHFIKIEGFVNATEEFKEHPIVLNGISDLLVQIFGESGVHARTAIGVNSLPKGACLEVSAIVEITGREQ